jgi:hypothetical protein
MSLADNKGFRWGLCPVMFLSSLYWLVLSKRALGLLLLVVTVGLYVLNSWHRHANWVIIAWLAFIFVTLLPIDVSFRHLPGGGPRFVPLVMGLPARETVERAKRGEVLLGGCVCSGFEPKWVWVW